MPSLALCNPQTARPPDPLAGLTDAQRRQVGRRLAMVQTFEQMTRDFAAAGRPVRDALSAFRLANPDITRTTLYRWLADYRADGPIGLVDRRGSGVRGQGSGVGRAVPANSIGPAAWQRFLELWLTHHRRSVALCYQIVAAEAASHSSLITHDSSLSDWSWPSLRVIQRAAGKIPATQRDWHRLGEKEWRRRHAPKIHRDYESIRPGEHWVADFHQWDVFCRRSETDPTIVRPLLSAWLDMRSRALTGWDIGERECSDAVLLAFRRGVETYGPPQQVTIDNGKPYRAYGVSGGRPSSQRKIDDEGYVRSVFAGLSVMIHFSIPYNPDSKPIEGWFGMLEQQFGKTFASYCSGDLKSECFRQAHKLAIEHPEQCPTVAELAERFGLWLEAYHATPHSAADLRGLSPAQAYGMADRRSLTADGSLDPIPRAIVPDGALDILLMRTTQSVKVGQYGVRYNGIEYGMTDPRLQRMHGQEVCLRIDPIDASYVIVCDLQGRPLLRAVNNRLALNEIDQDHVAAGQRAKKRARRLAKEIQDGGLRPALQDVTTAAIAAKHKAAQAAQAMQQLVRATGTDDAGPRIPSGSPAGPRIPSGSTEPRRNVAPLRSDFAEAMKAYNPVTPPPQGADGGGLTSLADLDSGADAPVGPPETLLSLADLDDADDADLESETPVNLADLEDLR